MTYTTECDFVFVPDGAAWPWDWIHRHPQYLVIPARFEGVPEFNRQQPALSSPAQKLALDHFEHGALIAWSVPLVETSLGVAVQEMTEPALQAHDAVEDGQSIYQGGRFDSGPKTDEQVFSLENLHKRGYASRDAKHDKFLPFDYVIEAVVRPGAIFVTRRAGAPGGNHDGRIEVVVPPGGVTCKRFEMGLSERLLGLS